MEKRYRVSADLQGGDFGMGRIYTIEQWREQAIDWADMDEHDGLIETLKALPKDEVLDEIAEFWQLEFEEIDVYNYQYDYDDIKIAICVANRLSDWNLYADFEYIAQLVIFVKDNWCVDKYDGNLSKEDFGYIQSYAYKLLDELKNKIMEELA